MAIEAPLSRYKRNNSLLITAILIVFGVWFWYDAYKNPEFIAKHTKPDQTMDSTLKFNRYGWPFFVGAGLVTGALFVINRNKKVTADDQQLTVGKRVIPYAAIEKINKTNFDKRGYFTITYKDSQQEKELTLSERVYDNLAAVLDHIVSKIS
ncbi:MAG: hypothetical protein LLF76_15510 [Planctomycetaceae bacterium]|nr:hypothetical protein [Planctomycetaceae bacterium]